jgi:hypothetical protein
VNDEVYIVIADILNPSLEFGEAIRESTITATNFKKAYDMALIIGKIHEPRIGYKASLRKVTNEYAVQIEDKSTPKKVTIARVKKY